VTYWRLVLAWEGTHFHGWQLQPGVRTIQMEVEGALSKLLNQGRVRVVASGRTDSGVHARQQFVSFSTTQTRTPDSIVSGLNHFLPEDVVCLAAHPAPDGFDARHSTRRKCYQYRILARPIRCPNRRNFAWHIRKKLDIPRMSDAIQVFVGTHDFRSFQASGCSATNSVRTLKSARLEQHQDEVHLYFIGNGFLRYQVRNMVGTLVEIGLDKRDPDELSRILAARDRTKAGMTAPAHGLWLDWVEYLEGENEKGD